MRYHQNLVTMKLYLIIKGFLNFVTERVCLFVDFNYAATKYLYKFNVSRFTLQLFNIHSYQTSPLTHNIPTFDTGRFLHWSRIKAKDDSRRNGAQVWKKKLFEYSLILGRLLRQLIGVAGAAQSPLRTANAPRRAATPNLILELRCTGGGAGTKAT